MTNKNYNLFYLIHHQVIAKNNASIKNYLSLQDYQLQAEHALENWLPIENSKSDRLHEAMRYAVFSSGKRLRPTLVYATGQALGIAHHALDAPAVAVEMVHTYSLIHDDLPAMDNDDLRRGQLTCHKAYDEATAILAGNSLQALAFYILAHDKNLLASDKQRIMMIEMLAHASGYCGMTIGQATDLASVGKQLDIQELEKINNLKTTLLIKTCVKLSALLQLDIDSDLFHKLSHYAQCIGLAFQIRDDILNIESNTEVLGSMQGSDAKRNKPTYPSVMGLEQAKSLTQELHQEAISSLSSFSDEANALRQIADYVITRNK